MISEGSGFMFICSFKLSALKIIAAFMVCIAGAVAVISLLPDAGYAMNVNKTLVGNEISLSDINGNGDCVKMLSSFGVNVSDKPLQSGNVTVPETFDASFEKYNDLQKSQGFDLDKYRGKKVKRYTYKVEKLGSKVPEKDCYVTVLVYRKKVIGADMCCPGTGTYGAVINPGMQE